MQRAAASIPAAAIRVASLDAALAAAEAACRLDCPLPLACPPLANGAGPGWFWALGRSLDQRFPDLSLDLIFDAGGEPGTALAALRRGFRRVVFAGNPTAAGRLADIASQAEAEILPRLAPVLDLSVEDARKPARNREGNRAFERSSEWLSTLHARRV